MRKRRLDLGLLQREVAEWLGVSVGTITNWEQNRKAPAARYGPAIRRFLGQEPIPTGGDLPDRIRFIRWAVGLTQEGFADLLGVDRIKGWESGRHLPQSRNIEQIEGLVQAEVACVDASHLIAAQTDLNMYSVHAHSPEEQETSSDLRNRAPG